MKSLTGKVQGEYKEKQTWMTWLHDITETRSQSWPETLKIVRNSEPRPSALSDMAHNNDDADEQVFKNKGGGDVAPTKDPRPWICGTCRLLSTKVTVTSRHWKTTCNTCQCKNSLVLSDLRENNSGFWPLHVVLQEQEVAEETVLLLSEKVYFDGIQIISNMLPNIKYGSQTLLDYSIVTIP